MPDPIPNAPADEQLSASDIADLAGVSPSAVSNWRKRYVDFPAPIDSTGRWVRFRGEEVLEWLTANDKLPAAAGPSTELTSIDDVLDVIATGSRDPLESLAVAGAFAATLVEPGFYSESVLADLSELVGQELRALEGTEDLYSNLVLAEDWEEGYEEIADAVLKVAYRMGTSTRNNEGTTPPEVADFIAAAVAPSLGEHMDAMTMDPADVTPDAQKAFDNHYWLARSVYDPCAGVGRTLLRAAQEHGHEGLGVSAFGQEINPGAARVASLVNRLKNPTEETDIVVGNSLQQDHFPDRKADLVVAHPPFGLRLPDGLGDDPRWILGNPGRDGSSAWIQIALSKLSERGRAAVVVEPSWAFRGGPSRELRAALVRQNLLDGVIALPRGTFLPDTNIGGLLVLLAKDRSNREPPREPGEVLFVDWTLPANPDDPPPTGGQSFDGSTWKHCFANWRDTGVPFASWEGLELWGELQNEFEATPSFTYWPGILEEFRRRHKDQPEVLIQTISNFLSVTGFTDQATYEDIANNDFDLTPKRYLPFYSAFGQGAVESFEEESNRTVLIAEEATTTAKATVAAMKPLAAFYAGQKPDRAPMLRLTTLGDLQAAGWIEMIAGRGTGRTTDTAATEDTPLMLTSSWIREMASGKAPETHNLVAKSAKIPQDSLVKPGDVIFAIPGSDNGQTAVWTATKTALGAALGFGLYAIRVNVDGVAPAELTPDFVAAWCRTGHLSHQVQRLSTGDVLPKLRWRDLQRIEIPVPADAAAHDWFTKQMGLHADLRTSHKKLSLLVENLSTSESRFFDSLIASAEIAEDERFGV